MVLKVARILLFFIPFLFLLALLWQKDFAFNEDLGRHVKLGELIVRCHCVPTTNVFSYTYPNFPWFTNSWLSAVIFYETFSHLGKESLLYVKIIIVAISFATLYIYSWKNYSKFWSFILSIPLLGIFYFRFGLRPEIFSFLLFSLFLLMIEKYKTTSQFKYLYALIPLEILWVNLHIYFIFGIIIYVCLLLEKFFQKKRDKPLFAIFLLLILSTLINPLSYQMALLPFTIFHNYGVSILENQSIFTYFQIFSDKYFLTALSLFLLECLSIMLVILYSVLIVRIRKFSIYYFCISVVGMIVAIRMVRFLPVFSLLAFMPLVSNFSQLEKFISRNWDKDMIILGKSLFAITSSILVIMFVFLGNQNQLYGLSFQENYKGAADFIVRNNIAGPMLNSFVNGAYLTFRLYPQKVFIDARAEAYPAKFTEQFNNMIINPEIFNSWDRQYKFNYIVFYNEPGFTTDFIKYILARKEWTPVYVDHLGNIVFLRNNEKNISLIKKYSVHEKINVL